MLTPITLTVPATLNTLSASLSLLGLAQQNGISLQLQCVGVVPLGFTLATAADAVAIYAGVISNATSVAQLQQLTNLTIPGGSNDGRSPIFSSAPSEYPYLYAVRTAIGNTGKLTLNVTGQESPGAVGSVAPVGGTLLLRDPNGQGRLSTITLGSALGASTTQVALDLGGGGVNVDAISGYNGGGGVASKFGSILTVSSNGNLNEDQWCNVWKLSFY